MRIKNLVVIVLCGALLLSTFAEARAADTNPRKPSTPVVGKRVPGFWTHNAGGQITHIEDKWLREKWVLVEFWSSSDQKRTQDEERLQALRKHFLTEDRLLLFSVCVDMEIADWMKYINSKPDLERLDGGRTKFFSDSRWWQLSLGANDQKEFQDVIDGYGLQKMPQYFLVRPDEALAVGNIPHDKLKDVLIEHLEKPKAAQSSGPQRANDK